MADSILKTADKAQVVAEASAIYQASTVGSKLMPPGFKQSDMGAIPEDWEVDSIVNLADDCKVVG
jgi:hypothetical protein